MRQHDCFAISPFWDLIFGRHTTQFWFATLFGDAKHCKVCWFYWLCAIYVIMECGGAARTAMLQIVCLCIFRCCRNSVVCFNDAAQQPTWTLNTIRFCVLCVGGYGCFCSEMRVGILFEFKADFARDLSLPRGLVFAPGIVSVFRSQWLWLLPSTCKSWMSQHISKALVFN